MPPYEPSHVKIGAVSLDLSRLSVSELQQLLEAIRSEALRRQAANPPKQANKSPG